MRILVFSDSHGDTTLMHQIIEDETFDMIFHLGDSYDDMEELKMTYDYPIYGVVGNIDFREDHVTEILVLNGYRILLTHGHYFKVKSSPDYIRYYGKEQGVDLVLYGHSHISYIEEGKPFLMNPGSISRPKDQMYPTYGILEIGSDIKAEIKYVK